MSPWVFKNEEGKTHTHWTKHYSLVLFKTCSPLNHPHQFLSSYLWSSIMDNWRREILCSLVIFMVLKYVVVSTMAIQKTIVYHHNTSIMMMAYFCLGARRGWCGNLTGQVDMCHNFFLDHIFLNFFLIELGFSGGGFHDWWTSPP